MIITPLRAEMYMTQFLKVIDDDKENGRENKRFIENKQVKNLILLVVSIIQNQIEALPNVEN